MSYSPLHFFKCKAFFAFSLTWFLLSISVFGQGDGPRSFVLLPKGVWAFNTGWPGMNQNINPTGTILVHKAEVKVNVFPITTLYRTFSLANRFAPLSLMVNPDTLSGSALDVPPVIPLPTTSVTANGWSDGFVAFKLGLAGAPAQPGV